MKCRQHLRAIFINSFMKKKIVKITYKIYDKVYKYNLSIIKVKFKQSVKIL